MKQTKKILSLALAFLLMLSTLPFAVSAETVSSGTCGENLTWTLDNEGTLSISGTGAMYDYRLSSELPWYSHLKHIKVVEIENGVTSIGDNAFF